MEKNQHIGNFIFIEYTTPKYGNKYGIFMCKFCQEKKERVVYQVKSGYVKNCHCQQNKLNLTHGHSTNKKSSKTYETWRSIKKRCINKNHPHFKDYGGRGITICDEWLNSFSNFLKDMGEKPEGYSIDRIDNNKGYYKENCKWSNIKEQNNNKRNNTILEFNGVKKTISQWSDFTGIKDCTISERIKRGWSIEKTLTSPIRFHKKFHSSVPPFSTNAFNKNSIEF